MLIFMLIFASPAICKDPPASLNHGRFVLASYNKKTMVYLDVLSVLNSKVKHTDSFEGIVTDFEDHTTRDWVMRFRKEQNNTYSFCILHEKIFDRNLHLIKVNKTPSEFIPIKQGSVGYDILLTKQTIEKECDKALPSFHTNKKETYLS